MVVVVTLVMWWSLSSMIAYTFHNNGRDGAELERELFLGLSQGGVVAHNKRENLRRHKFSRRERYYQMLKTSTNAVNHVNVSEMHEAKDKHRDKDSMHRVSQNINIH